MKKWSLLLAVLSTADRLLADIPLDKNGHNKTAFSDFNYLPWTLLLLLAVGGFLFFNVLKNEKDTRP